jgi:transcriptional regulator with XRE-family HTH domain
MARHSIGREIKKIVKRRGFTVEEFAQALNVSKPNVFDIYKRESIDTALLERICKVLNHNFFRQFSEKYETDYERLTLKSYKEQNEILISLLKELKQGYSKKE